MIVLAMAGLQRMNELHHTQPCYVLAKTAVALRENLLRFYRRHVDAGSSVIWKECVVCNRGLLTTPHTKNTVMPLFKLRKLKVTTSFRWPAFFHLP